MEMFCFNSIVLTYLKCHCSVAAAVVYRSVLVIVVAANIAALLYTPCALYIVPLENASVSFSMLPYCATSMPKLFTELFRWKSMKLRRIEKIGKMNGVEKKFKLQMINAKENNRHKNRTNKWYYTSRSQTNSVIHISSCSFFSLSCYGKETKKATTPNSQTKTQWTENG